MGCHGTMSSKRLMRTLLAFKGDDPATVGCHRFGTIRSSEPINKVERTPFLNLVIGQSSTIFHMFPIMDQPLLVWWDPLFVLDFCLDILNCVTGLKFYSDGLSCSGPHIYCILYGWIEFKEHTCSAVFSIRVWGCCIQHCRGQYSTVVDLIIYSIYKTVPGCAVAYLSVIQ